MNVYEKIQKVKLDLLNAKLKKSGENRFSGFKYFELADFLPMLIKLCNDVGLFTAISLHTALAYLQITNIEDPKETLRYTSPMKDLELKGCNSVQALGGTETYSRRYLYLAAFDIVESDMFDANAGSEANEEIDVGEKPISKDKLDVIQALEIDPNKAKEVLKSFGYNKSSGIKTKDFAKVFEALKKTKEQ